MKKYTRRSNQSLRVQSVNNEPSMTQQQFANEVDANQIMKKYSYRQLPQHQGVYADLSEIGDYQSMMEKAAQAQQAFGLLPSELRERFNNDPASLIRFLQDPKNVDEGIRLGILERKQVQEAEKSSVATKQSATAPEKAPQNPNPNQPSPTKSPGSTEGGV
nr:MAG: internal scaffolding protein [Microvirus sp.]